MSGFGRSDASPMLKHIGVAKNKRDHFHDPTVAFIRGKVF
jgi:hypothetical protein